MKKLIMTALILLLATPAVVAAVWSDKFSHLLKQKKKTDDTAVANSPSAKTVVSNSK